MSQRGVFMFMFTVLDDLLPADAYLERWMSGLRVRAAQPKRFLDLDPAIRVITQSFQFAARLAEKILDPGEEHVAVTIGLSGTRDRALIARDDPERMMDLYVASARSLENTWGCKLEKLRSGADQLAVKAAMWFFERFNWPRVSEEVIKRIQGSFSTR